MMRAVAVVAIVSLCGVAVACASGMRAAQQAPLKTAAFDPAAAAASATFPPGREGELIAYGHGLIEQTPKYLGGDLRARMSCAACHPNAGRVPHQGSLLGAYATFPQWNKRSRRFIALQDRIAECFLYSMNGKPPAYSSKEMIAITAYIAFLSRGAKVGEGFAGQAPLKLHAGPPNRTRGAAIFAARCASCHGAGGNGLGLTYPPLWGPASFNDKAGMSRMNRIAPFVRAAMPKDAPGTLDDQQATDVAAFILAHPRPRFQASQPVAFPVKKASYF